MDGEDALRRLVDERSAAGSGTVPHPPLTLMGTEGLMDANGACGRARLSAVAGPAAAPKRRLGAKIRQRDGFLLPTAPTKGRGGTGWTQVTWSTTRPADAAWQRSAAAACTGPLALARLFPVECGPA